MNDLQWLAKVQALQTFTMLIIDKDPLYVMQKVPLIDDPIAFVCLDDDNMHNLDAYFEKWNLALKWKNYKVQVEKDYFNIPFVEFRKKYVLGEKQSERR